MVLGAIFSYPVGVTAENLRKQAEFSEIIIDICVKESGKLRHVKKTPQKGVNAALLLA